MNVSRLAFEQLAQKALENLPERFRQKLSNVAVVVEQQPLPSHFRQAKVAPGSLLLGLYQGIPLTKRLFYSGVLPDKIILFQKSIESLAQNTEELEKIISQVLQHEIAHHFGFSEEKVRKWERTRKLTKNDL